jgi:hypothetical protein
MQPPELVTPDRIGEQCRRSGRRDNSLELPPRRLSLVPSHHAGGMRRLRGANTEGPRGLSTVARGC